MNLRGSVLERNAGFIEGGRGRPDDTDDLAAEGDEVDCILGMRVARAWQVLGQYIRDVLISP